MVWEGVERRRFPRAKLRCRIIVFSPHQRTITSYTENIGMGGVRVSIEEKLELFSLVGLELFIPLHNYPFIKEGEGGCGDNLLTGSTLREKSIRCEGRVVWVVEKPNISSLQLPLFDTGFEFHKIEEEDRRVIEKLVENLIAKEKDD